MNFRGAARRLEDIDLPRIGSQIQVGEDELHMVMDVECAGSGFDAQGRPKMLREPHVLYRNLHGEAREAAVRAGLAYPRWGQHPYPSDSYPGLERALEIDVEAALRSCSWGLGQILGENHRLVGYDTAESMVMDLLDDEERHLEQVVSFVTASGLDDDLRRLSILQRPTHPDDCRTFARVYNGRAYERHGYHTRLARSHNRWRAIPDTPWGGTVRMPDPPSRPILRRGDRGEWVRELQEMLPVAVDGVFGPGTEAAVRAFQDYHDLTADGIVGPLTWETLDGTRP